MAPIQSSSIIITNGLLSSFSLGSEQALVATIDSIDAFTLLHAMAPMSFDASRLIDMACIAFAGLTMDQIQALRKAYRTTVVASKLNVC